MLEREEGREGGDGEEGQHQLPYDGFFWTGAVIPHCYPVIKLRKKRNIYIEQGSILRDLGLLAG